jgi:hypothetical protein
MIPAATADRIMIHTSAQNEFLALKRRLGMVGDLRIKNLPTTHSKVTFFSTQFLYQVSQNYPANAFLSVFRAKRSLK